MRWPSPSRSRRRRAPVATFDPAWRTLLADHLAAWAELDDDERSRLEQLTARLLAEKHWEAGRGFALSETVQVVISAQAALLVLNLGSQALDDLHTLIVHPGAQTQRGERPLGAAGVRTDRPRRIHGRTGPRQPVVVSWAAARRDGRNPARGYNVVHHELAHHLDGRDGTLDGTPPLAAEDRERWVRVCTNSYQALRSGEPSVLRAYAAESPAEFFAVATEVFLSRPVELEQHHRALYEVLRDFYRQDPAARRRRAEPTDALEGGTDGNNAHDAQGEGGDRRGG